jgi:diguanylate cyclase (GGDEF)-like protein
MAKVLQYTFRESDIIARVGGDEFVVFAVAAGFKETEAIAERLWRNLGNYNMVNGHKYQLSVSLGKALYRPGNPLSLHDMINAADKDMYQEKAAKKMQ